MSMSINTPPLVKVDTFVTEQQAVSDNKVIPQQTGKSLGTTPLQTSLRPDNTAITPETALRQLFDMLEGIFRAMRDIFSGKTPIKPDSGKLPIAPDNSKELVKPDAGKSPVKPDTPQALIKPDAGKQPVKPDTPQALIKPDAGKQPVKPDTPQALIKPDAGKQPVKPDTTQSLIKPDPDTLPVKPDTNKERVKPDAGMRVLPQPNDPLVNVPGNKPHPMPLHPTVPKPEISVDNDPKTNVNVNVVVGHCHCPDGKVLPDRLPPSRVSTDTKPQPPVLPGDFPRPNVPMDTKTQRPMSPDAKPTPLPDAPTPDLTSPGPVDDRTADRHGRFNRLSSRF